MTTAHPFEIKPSASATTPDELLISWGSTPTLSVASIYLPAVSAGDIIALANTLYVSHRLTTTDGHTVSFPAGDVTFVPIPPGQGRYAGLLSLALAPQARATDVYTIAVRQLTRVSAVAATVPGGAQANAVVARKPFSWRQVRGAFQYTLTVTPAAQLRYPSERLLAWLKWRVGVTPPSSRWLPVLQRYLEQTEGLVLSLGTDPASIPPSQVGDVPSKGAEPPHGPPPLLPGEAELTGKIEYLSFDRFGDFSGFLLLTESGHEHRFHSREAAIQQLVHTAWVERSLVSVVVDEHEPVRPVTILLRRPH